MLWRLGQLDAATECLRRARVADERFGFTAGLRWLIGEDMLDNALRGRWDEALQLADAVIAAAADDPHYHEGPARMVRAAISTWVGATWTAHWPTPSGRSRSHGRPRTRRPSGLGCYTVRSSSRAPASAGGRPAARRVPARPRSGRPPAAPVAAAARRAGPGARYLFAALDESSRRRHGSTQGRAAASGDLATAATIYDEIGARAEEAQARLRLAEALLAEGRRREADAELHRSLAYFRSVNATAYTSRGEALLAATA